VSDVSLRGISKRYTDALVVDALDLDVRQGEFLTLLGPSGCGKTTTLRIVAGLIEPTRGRVLVAGEDVTALEPRKRRMGMVFQDYALFPHLTIAENIAFGLVERKTPRDRIAMRVRELLELVRLGEYGNAMPAELSGGQQQRVALARAIAHPPRVLLMDEPLGALDLKLREHMQMELRRIQQQLGLTTIYVTHDQTEAMTMSDRIAVMNRGRIEQLGSPEDIYGRPGTRFVASFVGKVNFLGGVVRDAGGDRAMVETSRGIVQVGVPCQPRGTPITLAIRPERLALESPTTQLNGCNALAGRIVGRTFCGNVRQYEVQLGQDATFLVETRPGDAQWNVGDEVRVTWHREDAVVVSS
jgi:spermidine/putrescine ABC transporter ATP-binding subunit